FSSRRRHTRSKRDWSSDVCSSDLSGEAVMVYFYSPRCVYCQRTTPVLVPLTEELNIDMKKLNLLEFKDEWDIESTPTLVHYEDRSEERRVGKEYINL